MDLNEFTSPGRDQFGRKYPIKVLLKEGRVLFGNIVAISAYDVVTFVLIPNIENWSKNIEQSGSERLQFNADDIEEISVYKSY